jgi:hypothetical protein
MRHRVGIKWIQAAGHDGGVGVIVGKVNEGGFGQELGKVMEVAKKTEQDD